jgi:hypothetical protein
MSEFTISALSLIGIGFAIGYAAGFMRGWYKAHKKATDLIQTTFRRERFGK